VSLEIEEIREELNDVKKTLDEVKESLESLTQEKEKEEEKKSEIAKSLFVEKFKEPMLELESGEILEELPPAYGRPERYLPPAYPRGLYPVPKLIDLIKRLASQWGIEITGTLKKFLARLGGVTEEEEEGEGKGEGSGEIEASLSPRPSSKAKLDLDTMPSDLLHKKVDEMFPKRWGEKS